MACARHVSLKTCKVRTYIRQLMITLSSLSVLSMCFLHIINGLFVSFQLLVIFNFPVSDFVFCDVQYLEFYPKISLPLLSALTVLRIDSVSVRCYLK